MTKPVFGVLGRSLPHTLSPQLHNMIYEFTGYSGTYNIFEVEPEQVENVVSSAKGLNISGINVTIPYKQDVIPFLDDIDPQAKELGAVNTIKLENGIATGYNTDYYGFLMSLLHKGIEIKDKSFLLCGVSGSGKAIHRALINYGAREVLAASTNPEKGIPYSEIEKLPDMDVIVNCTPVGMYPKTEFCVVEDSVFDKFNTAVDIIYNPVETLFLKKAREKGLRTLSGLYMLIFQGIKSFEIWTGKSVDSVCADMIFEKLRQELIG